MSGNQRMKSRRILSGKRTDPRRRTLADAPCEIRPFIVMEVLEKALALERAGRSIIHLEVGEPDFPTPSRIVQSAMDSLAKGQTHYTDSRGIIELRAAVARYHARKYGTDVSEDRVLVTMGTSPALLLVLSLLIEEPGTRSSSRIRVTHATRTSCGIFAACRAAFRCRNGKAFN